MSKDPSEFGHTQFFIEIRFQILSFLNIFPFLRESTDTLQFEEDSTRSGLSNDGSRD